jgi:hypothetical protein
MLIRHAEKPDGTVRGVDPGGGRDAGSLIPRGWQRAGALCRLFSDPPNSIAKPTAIYTVQPKTFGGSSRPSQTVSALAAKIGVRLKSVGLNATEDLVRKIMEETGDVLVCWEHKRIPKIAAAILEHEEVPKWSGSRFDMIWILRRSKRLYKLEIVPQMLLHGDLATTTSRSARRRSSR